MNQTTLAGAGASKSWDLHAFSAETDAQAFLDSITKPKR